MENRNDDFRELNAEELEQLQEAGELSDVQKKKLKKYVAKQEGEAAKLLEDEDKMERFLQKLEKKLRGVPLAGKILSEVPLLISMVRMYMKKEYTDAPITTMISIVAALLYFVSPIDLIPDVLPVIGYLDDAFVIATCVALIKGDLVDYKAWRKEQGLELEAPDEEEEEDEEAERLLGVTEEE